MIAAEKALHTDDIGNGAVSYLDFSTDRLGTDLSLWRKFRAARSNDNY